MDSLEIGGLVAVVAFLCIGGTYFLIRRPTPPPEVGRDSVREVELNAETTRRAETRASELLEQSRRDAEQIVREAELKARDDAFRRREELTRELETARAELRELERRVEKREDAAEQKQKELARKEKHLDGLKEKIADRKEALEKKSKHLEELIEAETKKLHEITGLSPETARAMLLDRLARELADEVAAKIRQHEERIKQQAELKAREIITVAIQRYAAEQTAGTTVSTVDIPSDDMKGRIIGREGRNIRTFEK
jgi:ribonuclease Y